MVLQNYFAKGHQGRYVDVGAHHPFRFSNTFKLYQQGWSGINIDPLPGSMDRFAKFRPRDVNLEIGVSDEEGSLIYYEFDEPALNGFHAELSQDRNSSTGYRILKTSSKSVRTLRDILNEHFPATGPGLDLISVDAEGFDLNVLKSNDWVRFRPKVIIAELRQVQLDKIYSDPVYVYLKSLNYSWFACTGRSCFFEDQSKQENAPI